jgi:predicted amidohydrolase YtcJ
MADIADYIFHGGNIVTIDDSCPTPEALATKEQIIISVGNKDEVFKLAGPKTKYVELKGNQTLLPGLIEPHQHPTHMILSRSLFVSCSGYYYHSYKQIKYLFEKNVAKVDPASGKWCIFDGWDPELIPDLPPLTAEILDELSSNVPIVVLGQSGHIAWANHKALEVAGITDESKDPDGGFFVRDEETKKLTGQMMEPPAYLILLNSAPQPTHKEIAQAVDDQWRDYACAGFTTVAELLYFPNEVLEKVLRDKVVQPDCPIRLAIYEAIVSPDDDSAKTTDRPVTIPLKKRKLEEDSQVQNDKLWLAGVKIIADGSPHCGSMATREPFLVNDLTKMLGFPPTPCFGSLNYSDKQLHGMVQKYHGQGKQIAIHAHGERAIEQVLTVYEQVGNILRAFIFLEGRGGDPSDYSGPTPCSRVTKRKALPQSVI